MNIRDKNLAIFKNSYETKNYSIKSNSKYNLIDIELFRTKFNKATFRFKLQDNTTKEIVYVFPFVFGSDLWNELTLLLQTNSNFDIAINDNEFLSFFDNILAGSMHSIYQIEFNGISFLSEQIGKDIKLTKLEIDINSNWK